MVLFSFQGKTHKLEFFRKFEIVTLFKRVAGEENKSYTKRSTFPFTTAQVSQVTKDAAPLVVAKFKVGCYPKDKFSNEQGRLEALRGLGKNLDKLFTKDVAKDFKTTMWDAYINRSRTKSTPKKADVTQAPK